MQLGRISQTSTSSCWLADADQSTGDNHGSKNAPKTTSKNCSRLLCAQTLCNTRAFHISIKIQRVQRRKVDDEQKIYVSFTFSFYFNNMLDDILAPPHVTFLYTEKQKSLFCTLSLFWLLAVTESLKILPFPTCHDTACQVYHLNHLRITFSPQERHNSPIMSFWSSTMLNYSPGTHWHPQTRHERQTLKYAIRCLRRSTGWHLG